MSGEGVGTLRAASEENTRVIISRESHESHKILLYAFGGIGVSENLGRCTQTSLLSRLIFLSFCHAELVSASVRGDVLEMARCEILKQVQDDICVLTAHCSPLTTHRSPLISYLSKNMKKDFWGEGRKYGNVQPFYNQVDANPKSCPLKHTKKTLKCFLSFT